MKILNKVLQIAALVFGAVALVCFVFPFVQLTVNGQVANANGLQLCFGAKILDDIGDIAVSSKLLFCFIMTVIDVALAVITLFKKSMGLRYWLAGTTLGTAIFMLVIALSDPFKFIDSRFDGGLTADAISYSAFLFIATAVIIVAAILAIAYMFVYDYVLITSAKNGKKPLLRRVIQFFKDYKSEATKIVWPKFKDVLKNTGIVLIMCLIIGIFVWLIDLGLGELLKLIW